MSKPAQNKNNNRVNPAGSPDSDNSIFRDRRQKTALHNPCRRGNHFSTGNAESTPWWLKVNYLNQQLTPRARQKAS